MRHELSYTGDINATFTQLYGLLTVTLGDYFDSVSQVTVYDGSADYQSEVPDYGRANFSTNYKYFVVKPKVVDEYLIFLLLGQHIGLLVSTSWDENKEIFFQDNIMYTGASRTKFSDTHNNDTIRFYANYISIPTIQYPNPISSTPGVIAKTIINFDRDTSTMMISSMNTVTLNHGKITSNMCFGTISKYGNWDGDGFWYGGDLVCTLECSYISRVSYGYPNNNSVIRLGCYLNMLPVSSVDSSAYLYHYSSVPNGVGRIWYDSAMSNSYCRYREKKFDGSNFNKFECFLHIDMDNAVDRPAKETEYAYDLNGNIVSANTFETHVIPAYSGCTPYTDEIGFKLVKYNGVRYYAIGDKIIPCANIENVWAVTVDVSNYAKCPQFTKMVVSVDDTSLGLPSYWGLLSKVAGSSGNTVNTLNNISLILGLNFMVMRDPNILNNFSYVGYTDVINYVDMKYMSSDRIINGTFPTKTDYYNCFSSGVRRSDIGFKGFPGLAFKMETNNE